MTCWRSAPDDRALDHGGVTADRSGQSTDGAGRNRRAAAYRCSQDTSERPTPYGHVRRHHPKRLSEHRTPAMERLEPSWLVSFGALAGSISPGRAEPLRTPVQLLRPPRSARSPAVIRCSRATRAPDDSGRSERRLGARPRPLSGGRRPSFGAPRRHGGRAGESCRLGDGWIFERTRATERQHRKPMSSEAGRARIGISRWLDRQRHVEEEDVPRRLSRARRLLLDVSNARVESGQAPMTTSFHARRSTHRDRC